MPMMLVEDNFEWAKRHSKEGEPVAINGRLVFADAAVCSTLDAAVRNEPPENDYQRLMIRQNYWRKILSDATTDFNQLRWALSGHGTMHVSQFRTSNVPRHDETGIAALEFLKAKVKTCRAKLAEIERELAKTPEHASIERRERVREEIREIQEQRDAEIRAEAAKISLD